MTKLMNRKPAFASLFLAAGLALALALVLATGAFAAPAAPAKAAAVATAPGELWTIRCEKGAEKQLKGGKCEVFQRLVIKETGQRMTEVAVGFPENKGQARGVLILPLGVLVSEGMSLKIDENKPFTFQIRYCSAEGCFAYVNLAADVLDTMRNGKQATLSFRTMEGKNVNVIISLKDFGKQLKQITS